MAGERLNSLAKLNIESDNIISLKYYENIINEFSLSIAYS